MNNNNEWQGIDSKFPSYLLIFPYFIVMIFQITNNKNLFLFYSNRFLCTATNQRCEKKGKVIGSLSPEYFFINVLMASFASTMLYDFWNNNIKSTIHFVANFSSARKKRTFSFIKRAFSFIKRAFSFIKRAMASSYFFEPFQNDRLDYIFVDLF